MGKIIIKTTSNGGYVFTIVADNHKVVGVSQTYKSIKSAQAGIASIRNNYNADVDDQTITGGPTINRHPKWEIYKDKANEFRFRLIAMNGEIILAASEGYSTKSAAKKGMESVRKNAVPVLALTNYPESPLAENATVFLLTTAEEDKLRVGAMSSMISQLLVEDLLISLLAGMNRERTEQRVSAMNR